MKKDMGDTKMKTAAISELKASLSEYLSRVKAGEEVLIMDRGKPVARIIPLRRERTDIPASLLGLERAGKVRIGTGLLPAEFWTLPRPQDKKGRALGELMREREEGR